MKNRNDKPLTLLEISEAAKKRVALITNEFTNGFEFIKNYPRSVTLFGSARIKESDHYYQKAKNLAHKIVSELHYSVITGGGGGIMEAANRGAYEAGGNSIGLTIELPHEQQTNEYITDKIGFHYFFSRKVCLAFSAEAFIFFPGGFGTIDEFTEIFTLMQTNKIPQAPIILFGEEYWEKLDHVFREIMMSRGLVDEKELSYYTITDNLEQIIEIIRNAPVRFGVAYNEESVKELSQNNSDDNLRPLSELAKKHCTTCEGGVEPFSHQKSEEYLKNVSQWTLTEDKEIEKTYHLKSFAEAVNFLNTVAKISEAEGHHPDLKLHDYKKVNVKISTHAIGGLSENDFILAAKIDEVVRG